MHQSNRKLSNLAFDRWTLPGARTGPDSRPARHHRRAGPKHGTGRDTGLRHIADKPENWLIDNSLTTPARADWRARVAADRPRPLMDSSDELPRLRLRSTAGDAIATTRGDLPGRALRVLASSWAPPAWTARRASAGPVSSATPRPRGLTSCAGWNPGAMEPMAGAARRARTDAHGELIG